MTEPSAPSVADTHSHFGITTRRPVAIFMIVLAVCVFGWVSYQRLSLDLMPDIAYPTLTVRTELPGTAPEEIETLVSRPLERELGIVPHLVGISSISKAGMSDIILEFEWDTDMNESAADIRERVDRTYLPDEADKPLLLRYDPSLDPIIRIGLFSTHRTLYELRELADHEIRRELESVPGVAAVKVKGGLEEEIHVSMNEQQMALLGLDISQINQRLAQANVNLPGGRLREGQTEYLVRTLNEFRTVKEIGELTVAGEEGIDIRLKDIADVYTSHRDREIITRVNGRESVELEIYKEADANIVAVAAGVHSRINGLPEQRAYVEAERAKAEADSIAATTDSTASAEKDEEKDEKADEKGEFADERRQMAIKTIEHLRMTDFISYRLPEGTELEILSDQSTFIVNSIDEVMNSAAIGGCMAVMILFVFLRNVLHTLIIGVTIPVSIVATFAPMFLFDVSLNIMSLGGLALGIGMLVDNSIVVLESIFRCREEGDDLLSATVRGTSEVGSAVFASTLTTIAVFFPIVFVEGVAGQVFGDMSLTVVFSLFASLLVALYFIPMLASRQVRRSDGTGALDRLREDGGRFFQLGAVVRIRRIVGSASWRARVKDIVLTLPQLCGEVLLRILMVVATLMVAVLKAVALILFQTVWPLLKIAERFWRKPERTWHAQVSEWGLESEIWKLRFFEHVWREILRMQSLQNFGRDAGRLIVWVVRSNGTRWRFLWWPLKGLLVLFLVVYLAVRFVVHTVLQLTGITLTLVLLLIALIIVFVVIFGGMTLTPILLPFLYFFERGFDLVNRAYPPLLRAALRRRWAVMAFAIASFYVAWAELVPELGSELIPQVYQGEFNLIVTTPVGTPLERTEKVATGIETVVQRQQKVERVATTVGTDRTASSTAEEGEHTAKITVRMEPGSTPIDEQELIAKLRDDLSDLPEVEVEVAFPALFSFKTPIELEIRGQDLVGLRRVSEDAVRILERLPGLADVRNSLQVGNPELQVVYDRDRLAEFGLNLRSVAELVRNKVQGRVATDLRRSERNIDILVRLREDDRLGVDELERLVVNPNGEVPIPLASVADIRIAEGPSEIRRIDQQRAALVTANIRDVDLASATGTIEATLQKLDFPPGFAFLISGQNKEMETSLNSMIFALALAIFLVYIVMASQFESLIHPFVIMFTVPLGIIGVVIVLFLKQIPLSVVVFIGLIMLAGIVVNNAIVLVDYINTLRRSGLEKTEAIVRAGSVRLRPILMTTLTTVLGLFPMALGLGDGAEIRTPMALTVIAGLTSSTFLTLVVIPTVYSIVDRGK
ncbi:MAG: efflux RND transporter permease subunit [Candidatus Latescibacterota bacterium]|nr:efflux RND transporter permease subunit [Candidatus Latescibacterota bacterium]